MEDICPDEYHLVLKSEIFPVRIYLEIVCIYLGDECMLCSWRYTTYICLIPRLAKSKDSNVPIQFEKDSNRTYQLTH